ncbi:MAG: aerotolerance regulator BatB [Cytophagales bacterium CG18_big_fil_WC_8_21_14_2_50_42_9]|nr:MAG: aerotolerance regulator BatB [Cytophagales bacterium CG18_big_fil_WC_8_21_14_2_50_42_9]
MSWYQSLSWLEIIFGTIFLLLYAGYIYRIKRLALYFKQNAHAVWIKFTIRSIYFFLLLVALLGPSFGATKKEILTTGKDVFVLVDLTSSMNTKDVAPSRLEKVKYELAQVIPALNADRVGLIVFSSEAFLQCPLTYDLEALQLYNRLLQTNQVPEAGANFRPALQLALDKFTTNSPAAPAMEKANFVLLFSDGEAFGEDVRPVLQRLHQNNIRVFTVGIGSEEGGLVPMGNNFKRDQNGERVTSRLQPASLKEIAYKTGGEYFTLNNQVNELTLLEKTINNAAAEQRESKTIDITANKYKYPLLLALLLIVIDALLTVTVIKI